MSKPLNYRNGLWLGTKQYMRFVPAPSRGAAVQSEGFYEEGTGKNGGGYIAESFGRHNTFQYDWPRSTDRQVANFIQGLKDGTYGRGVIHFTDPTSYETNVLPAHWANPGMTLGFETPPLVFRQQPEVFEFGMSDRDNTPLSGATYGGLPNITGFDIADAVFIPIPPGMAFLIGSRYESSHAGAGIFVTPVDRGMGLKPTDRVQLPRGINVSDPFQELVTTSFSGVDFGGVYIWVGRTNATSAAATVSILDMIGKLVPANILGTDWQHRYDGDVWYGGEGHTGVRFLGQPTIEHDSNRNTSVSATFKEVGAWELASRL